MAYLLNSNGWWWHKLLMGAIFSPKILGKWIISIVIGKLCQIHYLMLLSIQVFSITSGVSIFSKQ